MHRHEVWFWIFVCVSLQSVAPTAETHETSLDVFRVTLVGGLSGACAAVSSCRRRL
jgi:hypothetical protein